MKIAIYGAGSIGCYLGGRLAAVGCDVTFLCRPSMYQVLVNNGLKLSDYQGLAEYIPASELKLTMQAEDLATLDFIFICVKSAATQAVALELNRILATHRPTIISFQNSVSNVPLLKSILSEHTILEGMVAFNVASHHPGHFHQGTEGALIVKAFDRQSALENVFQKANLEIQFAEDMLAVQWAKVLLNLNNPINALSSLPLKQQLSLRGYRQCLAMAQTEALGLLELANIQPAKLTVLPAHLIPHLLNLPDFLFKFLSRKMLNIDPLARSSMQDDLNAGRATEVDWINGEVVDLARRLGREAPINARLLALIKQAEQSKPPVAMGAKQLQQSLLQW